MAGDGLQHARPHRTDYGALFGELEQIAVYDDETRSIITRVGDEYRQLGS
ncbi:MAG: hypothetical protein ACR2G2_13855 [Pseudonocardia sp.]